MLNVHINKHQSKLNNQSNYFIKNINLLNVFNASNTVQCQLSELIKTKNSVDTQKFGN